MIGKLFAAAVLTMAGCSCASLPTHNETRDLTVSLEFADGWCSGTKKWSDQILTATHCLKGGALIKVNGVPVKVVGIGKDKHDTAIIRVTGITFKRWARYGRPVSQGDRVRWWGTPGGNPDVYRVGYVSRAWTDGIVIDATICRGDSGAGIFNDAGEVTGVITAMSDANGCTFMISYPLERT